MTEFNPWRISGIIVGLLLISYGLFSPNGVYFRFVLPPTQTIAKSQTNPAATPSALVYELTKTRIADIKVGTRVPAFDPQLGTEIREAFAEANWAQWVKLNLEMTKSDGSLLKMEMLRHEDWVLENIDYQFLDDEDLKATSLLTGANSSQFLKSLPLEAPPVPLRTLFAELQDVRSLMAELEADAVLVTISLDLPEIGVRGEAVVTGVEPCPVILPGPGKVVLTTFHHASSHLIDLYLSPQQPSGANSPTTTYLTSTSNSATHQLTTFQTSEEALLYPQASRSSKIDPSWERIGVTGNHPIWSEDRHDYIAAMDLRVGERLKNLSGDTVYVQQKLPRPGPTPVYNLEVQDEHVYYVGANAVLAHNVGKSKKGQIECGNDAKLYEVDSAYNLRKNSMHGVATDTIAEHSPQTKWAKDLIPGHKSTNDYGLEAAIRVSTAEAAAITAAELLTPVPASARSALAIKIQLLRRHTKAPNSKLLELIRLNKALHPYDYLPLHRM